MRFKRRRIADPDGGGWVDKQITDETLIDHDEGRGSNGRKGDRKESLFLFDSILQGVLSCFFRVQSVAASPGHLPFSMGRADFAGSTTTCHPLLQVWGDVDEGPSAVWMMAG